MIRVQHTLVCDPSLEETFSFIADFENLTEWDPGIVSSSRLDDGPLGRGSRFRVVARFLRRRVPMVYEVTRYESPNRIVLEGTAPNLRAIDDIRFERTGSGTKVRYRADFTLSGALRLAEPILKPAFDRLAVRAMNGMAEALRRKAERGSSPRKHGENGTHERPPLLRSRHA